MGSKFLSVITSAVLTLKCFGYKDAAGVTAEIEQQEMSQHELAPARKKNKQTKRARWLQLSIFIFGLVVVSFGMAYILQQVLSPYKETLSKFAWLAYLGVFGVMLLGNLTIIAPVPVTAAIMVAVATRWDPLLVSIFASIGGSLGELSGYYAGYLGKKKVINGFTQGHDGIEGWMRRYGLWAVFFLALQPVLPFDVAGLAAGASRMPVWKFLAALCLGRFIKYVIICYFGVGLIHFLP